MTRDKSPQEDAGQFRRIKLSVCLSFCEKTSTLEIAIVLVILVRKGSNVWRLEENHNSLVAANLSVLGSFGEGLMETVCRDACSGHDIARVSKLCA